MFLEIQGLSLCSKVSKDFDFLIIAGSLFQISIESGTKLVFDSSLVKLYSELALPTELQLDRVGVDFVFPPS